MMASQFFHFTYIIFFHNMFTIDHSQQRQSLPRFFQIGIQKTQPIINRLLLDDMLGASCSRRLVLIQSTFRRLTFFTTSMPSTTDPNTQCLPSNQDVFAVHKKNWEPLVFGPALAIERIPEKQIIMSIKYPMLFEYIIIIKKYVESVKSILYLVQCASN